MILAFEVEQVNTDAEYQPVEGTDYAPSDAPAEGDREWWAAVADQFAREDDYAAGIDEDARLHDYYNAVAKARELDARAELYAAC